MFFLRCAVLDDRTLTALRMISLGAEQSPMLGCTLVASNGVVLTADIDNHTIWMCDALGAGKHEAMDALGAAHAEAVVAIDYSPRRDLFLTASADGNVKVLSGGSWAVLRDVNLARPTQTACFLNAKADIAVATELSIACVPASSAYIAEKTEARRRPAHSSGLLSHFPVRIYSARVSRRRCERRCLAPANLTPQGTPSVR